MRVPRRRAGPPSGDAADAEDLGGVRAPAAAGGCGCSVRAVIVATITCPSCGAARRETMPENACQYFYRCTGCGEMLKPKDGDGCVFCSYADTPCPPKATAA